MNKEELVTTVAQEVGITKNEASKIVAAVFGLIEITLAKGEEVNLPGFGKFAVTNRAARMGRNPQTGQEIKIEATTVPAFKPGLALKKAVAGEKA
jgi:DNA-binding protein HU-beta